MPFSAVAPTVMPPFIIASVAPRTGSCKNEDNFPTYHPHTIGNRCPALHLILGYWAIWCAGETWPPAGLARGVRPQGETGSWWLQLLCWFKSHIVLHLCSCSRQWLSLVTKEGWGTGHGLLGNQGPAPHQFIIQWLLFLQGKQNTISPHPVTIHHFAPGKYCPVTTWHQASPGSCQKSLSPSLPSAAATLAAEVFIAGLSAFPISVCSVTPNALLLHVLGPWKAPLLCKIYVFDVLHWQQAEANLPAHKVRRTNGCQCTVSSQEFKGHEGRRRSQQRRQPAPLALLLQCMLKEWCITGMPQGHKHLPSLS